MPSLNHRSIFIIYRFEVKQHVLGCQSGDGAAIQRLNTFLKTSTVNAAPAACEFITGKTEVSAHTQSPLTVTAMQH